MDKQDKTNEELQQELIELKREFSYLNALKDIDTAKRIQLEQELAVALAEIAFQNEIKENRAAELIIANLELKFQSEEKAKRATELVIANIELVFQNKEKAKRAAELIIANKELSFQNEEKAKRAAELIIALSNATDFENKFKQIAENIDEVFWLRTDSEMIYVSPSFEKIWGIPCQKIYENPQIFTDKIHPEDKPLVVDILQSNEFKEKELFEYEYRIIRSENQIRWINAKTVPIIDDSGQIIKRVGIASDITEKKERMQDLIIAKEKAEESNKLKSAFLANMSHEIRTPMNGILGFSALLKEPHLTDEQQQEYITTIEKSGVRMLNIINNIVDISKIESGLMEVNLSSSNINEQLEYVYTFFKPETEKKKLQFLLKKKLSAKETIITTDREKVYAILTNLVKNAIKYTNDGIIEIGCDKKGDNLEFYVKDTGIGIPSNRQEAVFERFIQADIADIHAFQGAGLGLTIAKAYSELLGGRIWLESEEGQGSTFFFSIPYNTFAKDKIANIQPAIGDKSSNTFRKLKILIAEDDETSEILMAIALKPFSKITLEARTGLAAIEICRKNPDIDLILMDIQMPGINGYEATRQIRQFNNTVIIIAQTSFGLSGDREKAIESGCNDYIAKPIKKEDLIAIIRKQINKKAI